MSKLGVCSRKQAVEYVQAGRVHLNGRLVTDPGAHATLRDKIMAFSALVFANVLLIMTNLSWRDNCIAIMRKANATFWWVCSGALGVMLVTLYVPFFRGIFHFGVLHLDDLFYAFIAGALSLVWFEALKMRSGADVSVRA